MGDFNYRGSDENAIDELCSSHSIAVPGEMSIENRARQVAATAGVQVDYRGSDRNLIDRIHAALDALFSLVLTGEFATDYGAQPADVDGFTFGKTGAVNGTGYLATTHPDRGLPKWESGVRLIEAQDTAVNGRIISAAISATTGDKFLSVRREGPSGEVADTHWGFVVATDLGDVAALRIAAPVTDVPAIGIDGATGECVAFISGVPVASLPAEFADFFSDVAELGLFGSLGTLGNGDATMTLVINADDFAHSYPGMFDIYGNDAG